MSGEKPLVSIIIPVYNGKEFLAEAIDSALGQSWENTEVIVVNDGSRDNTEEIAREYGNRIRYFGKENGGQSSALNYGISKMKGDYFSWLSHDDLYLPQKIEKQMALALQHPSAVIYSDWMTIDAAGKEISKTRIYNTKPSRFRFNLMTENRLHGCSMLVPVSVVEKPDVFKRDIPLTSDVDLWFRLAEKTEFLHVAEILVKGRVHIMQESVKKYRAHQKESDIFYARCFKSLSNDELLASTNEIRLQHLLNHLGRSFADREYLTASAAVNKRIRDEAGMPAAMIERLICAFFYQRKRLKNRIKYGLLAGSRK